MQITCSRHEAVREEREISGAERPPRDLDQRARERVPSAAAAAAAEQSRESGSRSQRLQATITFHITSVMKSIIRISTIFDPRSLSLSITHSLSRPRLPPSLLCSHLAVPRLTHESRSASTHPLSPSHALVCVFAHKSGGRSMCCTRGQACTSLAQARQSSLLFITHHLPINSSSSSSGNWIRLR